MSYEHKSRVLKSEQLVGDIVIPTKRVDFVSRTALGVEVGTTGLQGSDAGHGCCTYFSIRDIDCHSAIVQCIDGNEYIDSPDSDGAVVIFAGDSELLAFLDALKFAVEVLEMQIRKRKREDA